MTGIDRGEGAALDGWPHVLQSIGVILTTPIGSRVMRREFGSDLPKMIGRPMTEQTIIEVYAATAAAIATWEPRFELTGVEIQKSDHTGALSVFIAGVYEGDRVDGVVPMEQQT